MDTVGAALTSDLVNVEIMALVGERGSILPHQRSEGETEQLLLSFVLRCGHDEERDVRCVI